MKTTPVAIAALLSLGLCGTACATPIWLDFTGTVSGTTTSISGGFTFETDRLYDGVLPGPPLQRNWGDWQPTQIDEPLAFLNVGGQSAALPADGDYYYGLIGFVDACDASGCVPQWVENFSLLVFAIDHVVTPEFTGTSQQTILYFSSAASRPLPDFPYAEYFDYFDSTQVDPTSIVSLPLYDVAGAYLQYTSSCVAGVCETLLDSQQQFTIDTVTRGIGARPVPEPGTLGLFATALAGMFFVRRRVARAS